MGLVGASVFGVWHWWPSHRNAKLDQSTSDNLIEKSTEGRLRTLVRREVTADAMQDRNVIEGIQRIQERIAPAAGPTSYPLEIFVIDSPTVNAVSLPGDIVIVYSGLIRKMESPEELAAVLAHEIAHATHGDSMHALERELGMAAILLLAGGRTDALTTRLLRRLISSGFSRQQEQDADKEATRILASVDIDPAALSDSLRHMRQGDAGDSGVFQYVSTHPDLDARIKIAEAVSAAWKGKARPIGIDWQQFRSQFRVLH
jgi:beta-barrel assembly-enhancing protease